MKKIDLIGQKFGRLFVIAPTTKPLISKYSHDKVSWWAAKCECGTVKAYPGPRLKRGDIASCGCFSGRKKPLGESAKWACFTWYRGNAKRRKIAFALSLEQFLSITGAPCAYCGILWSTRFPHYNRANGVPKYHGAYQRNGIDRINSTVGYIPTNCVPCCKTCNFAKAEMSVDEFKAWIIRVHGMIQSGQFAGNFA